MRPLSIIYMALALFLAGCGDDAPEHYYVLCEGKDGAGWQLINTEYDEDGYLIACTYQSPDRQQAYTARCTSSGCD